MPPIKSYWMVATGLGELPKGKKTGQIDAYSRFDALQRLVRSQQIRPHELWLVAFEERR